MITPDNPWDAYMRLSAALDASGCVNNRSWGLEAGLDAVLAAATPAEIENIGTNIASAARRERHRAHLRRVYASDLECSVDQPARIEARVRLAEIRGALPVRDWALMSRVAVGMEYEAIARALGGTPGGLRVRALRIRLGLLERLAA